MRSLKNSGQIKSIRRFFIVMLVRADMLVQAGMNLILKIMWKLIVNKKKEYLNHSQRFGSECLTKKKQLKKLQMSAKLYVMSLVKKLMMIWNY